MSEKMCNECKRCDGDLCTYFDNYSDRESTIACILFEPKNPTVFDRITASPEVLAPEFVGMMYDRVSGEDRYYSMLTGEFYDSEEAALSATEAKLKEVAE